MSAYDTVVIGAGLAGMTAACRLLLAGQKVLVVAKGLGALLLSSAAIDLLGFHPPESPEPVRDPLARLDDFIAQRPDHPYAALGKARVVAGIEQFLQLARGAGLDYRGTINRNWLLPGTAGAIHPACLAPAGLAGGELSQGGRLLIVGFRELRDFYPSLICQNLNAQELGVSATPCLIETPAPAAGKDNVTPLEMARAFEQADFRRKLVQAIKSQIKDSDRVGFPAVLGLSRHDEVMADLHKQLGRPVFEISTLPPSVPGRRLFEALKHTLLKSGGRLLVGSEVVEGKIEAGRVSQVSFSSVNRLETVQADNYVLATGGIFGSGIQTDATGRVWEPIFNLPVVAETDRHQWFAPRFITPGGQPVGSAGIRVDQRLNPVNAAGAVVAQNLYVAGASIAGSNWVSGRTGNGVAVTTALAIAGQLTE